MEKNLQEYVVSMDYFLAMLGVQSNYERKQRWSHTNLLEVLHDLKLQSLICGGEMEPKDRDRTSEVECVRKESLDEKIRTGKILQVRDHYGKIRHYRSPYYVSSFLNSAPYDPVLLEDQVKRAEESRREILKRIVYDLSELNEFYQMLQEIEQKIADLKEQLAVLEANVPCKSTTFVKKYPKRKKRLRYVQEEYLYDD